MFEKKYQLLVFLIAIMAINVLAMDNRIAKHPHHHHLHHHIHPPHASHHPYGEDTCPEDVVEWRTRSGEIIFTGTIRKIVVTDSADGEDSGEAEGPVELEGGRGSKVSALAEVKRVLKGGQALNKLPEDGGYMIKRTNHVKVGTKLVVVEDLNNPEFCRQHEAVKVNDTRIFFAVVSVSGNLRLNSSLVKFSLRNIEIFEIAVKELLYLEKTKNKLYEKSMKMHINAGRPDSERFTDPCVNMTCDDDSTCVLVFNGSRVTAGCRCRDFCQKVKVEVEEGPVCGSDGSDYKKMCDLENANCLERKKVKVKFPGKCDPCSSFVCPDRQTCVLDHVTRRPLCRCGSPCTVNFDPVCGNDGRTYINQCTLENIACANEDDVWVLYKGECSSDENPCFDHICGPHETCRVDHSNSSYCTCPSSCPPIYIPICGNDGKTYDSDCHLKMEACLYRVSLFPRHPGPCKEVPAETTRGDPCSGLACHPSAKCILKDDLPVCDCRPCADEYNPVCGSDMVTYDSRCLVDFINCKENTNVTVSQSGVCDSCIGKKCHFYSKCITDAEGRAHCVCDHNCSNAREEKVCATDGKTHANVCEMEQTSCILQREISIVRTGECDACDGITCPFGGMCREGKCTCDFECQPSEPVCGEDGISYPNACLMRRSMCQRNIEVKMAHPGRCQDEPDGTEESSGSGDLTTDQVVPTCDAADCRHLDVCAPSTDGSGGKVCACKFNCGAVRAPVCGSDGRTYGSECLLMEEACLGQRSLSVQYAGPCEGFDFGVCDGRSPLVDPVTKVELSCHNEACPPSSYCHKQGSSAKCCPEESSMKSCVHSTFGCCPDGNTTSLGPNLAGCEPPCDCNVVGSKRPACHPTTGECTCRPGVAAPICDRCLPGFWGFQKIAEGNEGCTPCTCNLLGSLGVECDQLTGRCPCRPHALGQKCDFCQSGKKLDSTGCFDEINPTTSSKIFTTPHQPWMQKDLGTSSSRLSTKASSMISFSGSSYFAFKLPRHFSKSLSLNLVFTAVKADGILFFVGQRDGRRRDHYFLAIRKGHVVFRYDLGSGPVVLTSAGAIELGRWHQVEATRFGREGTLRLDHQPAQTGFSRGSLNFLDLEEGIAYVGDVANRTSYVTQVTGVSGGFHGCLEFLAVRTHEQAISWNFTKDALDKNIKEKSNIGDCGECSRNACLNEGVCSASDPSTASFTCDCPPGYFGKFCEMENPCSSNPCRNSGTCVSLGNETFHCKCRIGFRGKMCDIDMKRHVRYVTITMPEFHKNSYISAKFMDSISLVRSVSMEIWFLSYESSGVLMSAVSADGSSFIMLILRSGVIQLISKIRRTHETLTSPRLIKASKWNKVLITMTNGEGLLMVNNDHPVMKHPPPNNNNDHNNRLKDKPEVGRWPTAWNIHLGAAHDSLGHVTKNTSSFHGAFQRIYMNGIRMGDILQPLIFKNGKTLLRTLSQQHVTQYDGFPCPSDKNPCGTLGTCISFLNEHLCRCRGRNVTLKSCQTNSSPLYFDGESSLSYQPRVEGVRRIQIRFKSESEAGELFHLSSASEKFKAVVRNYSLLIEIKVNGLSSVLISNTNVSNGVWHKVLLENDYRGVVLYIDGVLADNVKAVRGTGHNQHARMSTMWIGGRNAGDKFVGCVESVLLNKVRFNLWKDDGQRHAKLIPCT